MGVGFTYMGFSWLFSLPVLCMVTTTCGSVSGFCAIKYVHRSTSKDIYVDFVSRKPNGSTEKPLGPVRETPFRCQSGDAATPLGRREADGRRETFPCWEACRFIALQQSIEFMAETSSEESTHSRELLVPPKDLY